MENLKIEDAHIIFKNFAGKAGKFTPEGRRSFHVVLDEDTAMALKADGWNVKARESKYDDGETYYTLPVFVNYDFYPPHIYIVANGSITELDEETVAQLDTAEIDHVDMILRPRSWEVNGSQGIKAYVKSLYAVIEVDDLAQKYGVYSGGKQAKSRDYDDEDDAPF